jgi:hypothetical protein
MSSLNYSPPPSLEPFFVSDQFINLVIGPVGSTKTTAGIVKIAYEAKRIKACKDGIRRSRCIWIRQSREQLRDTSIPDFLRWFPDGQAGIYQKTEYKFVLKFDDVECEILFRGLDDASDTRRLLSLQATFGIADEFRELNMDIFNALQGRLGRYPSKADNGVGSKDDFGNQIDKFWGMSNPPDFDTPWEKYLTDPPENAAVFFQPSGMSEEADWLQYLKDDYYDNLCEGKTQDWVDIYVHGKFGRSLSGQPVFPSFSVDAHVAKSKMSPIRSTTTPLILGFDFGLTPACVIGQLDPFGRALVFDAVTSQNMGILRFCREKLKPLLAQKYPGQQVLIIGDPAGVQRAQTDERSVFDILRQEGFRVVAAKTNTIVSRIAAVEGLLTRMVDGKAAIQIDPGCSELIKAFRGGYRYKIKKAGDAEEMPEKNGYSHISDAMQYFALHINQLNFGDTWQSKARKVEKIRYAWA